MNIEDLNSILKGLSDITEIKPSDIPDIDLYMDQVTTFIDNKLGSDKRSKKDKLLTKTMINNYSKAKILAPSKNKKYNKQQMIQLVLIYYLKQILSIGDIEDLFTPLFDAAEDNSTLVEDIYCTYLQAKKNNIKNVSVMLKDNEDLIAQTGANLEGTEKNKVQLIATAMLLTSQAQAYKRTAEAIIDNHFKVNT
ncbi:MAG: DUF1836 domain-containing protein [Lutisporaceae bacterium]